MAADVDILIAVENELAKRQIRETQQEIQRLADVADGSAKGGLRKMTEKFGQLGSSLSHISPELGRMTKLTHAFELLADPVALAAVGIAGLGLGIYKLYEGFKELDEEMDKEKLRIFAANASAELKKLNDVVKIYLDTLAEGKTETEAALASRLANAKKDYADQYVLLTELIAEDKANQREAQGKADQILNSFGKRIMQAEADEYGNQVDFLQVKLEALAQTTGRTVKGIKDSEEASKRAAQQALDEAKAQEELTKALQKAYELRLKLASEDPNGFGQQGLAVSPFVAGDTGRDSMNELALQMESTMALSQEMATQMGDDFAAIGDSIARALSGVGKTVFDEYTNALYDVMTAHQVSAKGIVKALQAQVKGSIIAIGQDAAVRAIYEEALALSSLAFGDGPGFVLHQTAAAEYGAVAMLAGAAAAAMGGTATGGGGGGRGGSGGGGGPGGSGGSGTGGDQTIVNVTVIGTLDDRDAESLHNQIKAAVQRRDLN